MLFGRACRFSGTSMLFADRLCVLLSRQAEWCHGDCGWVAEFFDGLKTHAAKCIPRGQIPGAGNKLSKKNTDLDSGQPLDERNAKNLAEQLAAREKRARENAQRQRQPVDSGRPLDDRNAQNMAEQLAAREKRARENAQRQRQPVDSGRPLDERNAQNMAEQLAAREKRARENAQRQRQPVDSGRPLDERNAQNMAQQLATREKRVREQTKRQRQEEAYRADQEQRAKAAVNKITLYTIWRLTLRFDMCFVPKHHRCWVQNTSRIQRRPTSPLPAQSCLTVLLLIGKAAAGSCLSIRPAQTHCQQC